MDFLIVLITFTTLFSFIFAIWLLTIDTSKSVRMLLVSEVSAGVSYGDLVSWRDDVAFYGSSFWYAFESMSIASYLVWLCQQISSSDSSDGRTDCDCIIL